jgi:hypothetical protein
MFVEKALQFINKKQQLVQIYFENELLFCIAVTFAND